MRRALLAILALALTACGRTITEPAPCVPLERHDYQAPTDHPDSLMVPLTVVICA